MVDTINNAADSEATSPTEKVERLIPVYNIPENNKPVVDRHIFDECLTPECDC